MKFTNDVIDVGKGYSQTCFYRQDHQLSTPVKTNSKISLVLLASPINFKLEPRTNKLLPQSTKNVFNHIGEQHSVPEAISKFRGSPRNCPWAAKEAVKVSRYVSSFRACLYEVARLTLIRAAAHFLHTTNDWKNELQPAWILFNLLECRPSAKHNTDKTQKGSRSLGIMYSPAGSLLQAVTVIYEARTNCASQANAYS